MLIQMTKKMIEFLISGYEYYENERKSRHNEKIWLINQVKVIYRRKETVWNYSFVFTRFFRKSRLDKTNMYDVNLLDNVKKDGFL